MATKPEATEKASTTPTLNWAQLPDPLMEITKFLETGRLSHQELILTGSAVGQLYHGKPWQTINDFDCLIIGLTAEEVFERLSKTIYGEYCKIQGKRRPIVHLCIPHNERWIEIDINPVPYHSADKTQNLIRYLQHVDFKHTSVCMTLDSTKTDMPLYGFFKSMKSMQEKKLGIIRAGDDIFKKDICCLVRLFKYLLLDPTYTVEPNVLNALRKIKPLGRHLSAYLTSRDSGKIHQGQLANSLKNLFWRFGAEKVFAILNEHQFLEGLSDFDTPIITSIQSLILEDDALRSKSSDYQRCMFYFGLTAYYLLTKKAELKETFAKYPSEEANPKVWRALVNRQLEGWTFYLVARHLPPTMGCFYPYMVHTLMGTKLEGYFNLPELDSLMQKIKCLYQQNNDTAEDCKVGELHQASSLHM